MSYRCFAIYAELLRARSKREADRTCGCVGKATPPVDYIDAMTTPAIMIVDVEEGLGANMRLSRQRFPLWRRGSEPFDKAYPKYPGASNLIAAENLASMPAIAFPNNFARTLARRVFSWGDPPQYSSSMRSRLRICGAPILINDDRNSWWRRKKRDRLAPVSLS